MELELKRSTNIRISSEDGLIHLEREVEQGNIEYKRSLVSPTPERLERLTSQMKWRLFEGHGEAIYQVGVDDDGSPFGLCEQDLAASIDNIRKMASSLNCEASIICNRKGKNGECAEILVREIRDDKCKSDIRIAVCGHVDSGKSTLIGVLTEGRLDNGRGCARVGCFKHQHEITSGRTSSISHHILGFNSKGECINSVEEYHSSWGQIIDNSYKIISFIDLAGHERYLKTTVFGMLGHMPDYCFLVIAANVGLKGTTREHLQLAISMKIPVVIIVTKIDICPPKTLKNTLDSINTLLSTCRKNSIFVDSDDTLIEAVTLRSDESYIPIFSVSNVTGDSLPLLIKFLNLLPLRNQWQTTESDPAEVLIAQTFSVRGVDGVIVGGIVSAGCVKSGDCLKLGPDEAGNFKEVTIESIHSNRIPVREVKTGQFATFALSIPRSDVRKGMVLIDTNVPDVAIWTFEARVTIIQHASPICKNYQPVIQCKTLRQCARIIDIVGGKESIKKGDTEIIRFQFLYKPEYIKEGLRIIIGEGRTRGIGYVSRIIPPSSFEANEMSCNLIELSSSNELIRSGCRTIKTVA